MPRFAITDTTSDQVLGQIGIAVNAHYRSAEAYYWVLPEQRRRGVASAALGLVADWAFAPPRACHGLGGEWLDGAPLRGRVRHRSASPGPTRPTDR